MKNGLHKILKNKLKFLVCKPKQREEEYERLITMPEEDLFLRITNMIHRDIKLEQY